VAQHRRGVHGGGARRRYEARSDGEREQHQRDGRVRRRIAVRADRQTRERGRRQKGDADARREAGGAQPRTAHEHKAGESKRIGAERAANGDLAHP
jgi:hypothetical protein